MRLFENEEVKKATSLACFVDFINAISPLYDYTMPLNTITHFSWHDKQAILSDYIITGLNNLKDSANQPPSAVLPKIIKGVYFCLADDGLHFTIHGSLYYNEKDWAAHADYYNRYDSTDLMSELSAELTSLKLTPQIVEDLLYLFAAFTLLKTLNTIDPIPDIANAVMSLGYCDGDELILGHFKDQQFIEHIEIIDNGDYDNPSTAPVIVPEIVAPRGDLWEYMWRYHRDFLKQQDLSERFYTFGEEEAERISETFKDSLILNRCPLCNFLRKTPRARLCFKCGEFTPPVQQGI